MYKRSYHDLNFTRKNWSWFKFNNLGLALDKNLKFYTSLSKGLIPTFVEVTEEKLVGGGFFLSWIALNKVFIILSLHKVCFTIYQVLFYLRLIDSVLKRAKVPRLLWPRLFDFNLLFTSFNVIEVLKKCFILT